MHEASLMRSLMRKIDSLAAAEGANKVTTVRVWLGALSHMSAAHFQEHFEQASEATIAEGASLEIEESADIDDPNAQGLLLRSIEIET
jgi:hydrogenase nickel incorporation protein HypA/HybF